MAQFNERQTAWIRRWRRLVHANRMTNLEFERHVGEELRLLDARISSEEIAVIASEMLDSMTQQ